MQPNRLLQELCLSRSCDRKHIYLQLCTHFYITCPIFMLIQHPTAEVLPRQPLSFLLCAASELLGSGVECAFGGSAVSAPLLCLCVSHALHVITWSVEDPAMDIKCMSYVITLELVGSLPIQTFIMCAKFWHWEIHSLSFDQTLPTKWTRNPVKNEYYQNLVTHR